MNLSQRMARTAIGMCCATLMLAIAACGGGNSSDTPAAATPSSTETQAQTFKASDYFAANAGDQRVFTNDGESATGWNARVEYVTSLLPTTDAAGLKIIDTKLDGTDDFPEYVLIDQVGSWSSTAPINPTSHANAKQVLPAEFKVGDKFTPQDYTLNTNEMDVNGAPYVLMQHVHTDVTILGPEDITTHAGLFKNCVKTMAVTTTTMTDVRNGVSTSDTPRTVRRTTWYALGMGKVRDTTEDDINTSPMTRELYAYQIAGIRSEQERPTALLDSWRPNGAFLIRFSEPMLLATLNSSTIQITDPNGQQVPITTSTFGSASLVTVAPEASYVPVSGVYQIKLNDKATDLAGNSLVPFEQPTNITITPSCCDGTGATILLWAH